MFLNMTAYISPCAVLCYEMVSVGINEPLVEISLSDRTCGLSHHTGKFWRTSCSSAATSFGVNLHLFFYSLALIIAWKLR